jgi:hypothetical protein
VVSNTAPAVGGSDLLSKEVKSLKSYEVVAPTSSSFLSVILPDARQAGKGNDDWEGGEYGLDKSFEVSVLSSSSGSQELGRGTRLTGWLVAPLIISSSLLMGNVTEENLFHIVVCKSFG